MRLSEKKERRKKKKKKKDFHIRERPGAVNSVLRNVSCHFLVPHGASVAARPACRPSSWTAKQTVVV